MTSSGHVMSSVMKPFDSPWALSYRLPIGNNLLSVLVSVIFSLKDVDIASQPQTDIHDD